LKNLTTGSPTRLLLSFTLPLLIGNVFQQVYSVTDAAVVGRMIGVDALAAVGATGSLVFLLIGFTWGGSSGLAIPISKAFGADDEVEMRRMVAAGAYASAGIALVLTLIGVLFEDNLLRLLGTPADIMPGASAYLRVTMAGAALTMTFNYLSAIIRAVGDATTPLIFLVASSVLNAGLVVLFVGGFGMGVASAAGATLVAQGVTSIACLILLKKRDPQLIPRRADWRAGLGMITTPLRTGIPMGFQMSVIGIGTVVLQSAVNDLGTDAVAAYAAASRAENIAIAPMSAFGVAVVTYVAQNRGAERWERVRFGVGRAIQLAIAQAIVLGGAQILLAPRIVGLFVNSHEVAVTQLALTYLRLNALLYGFLAVLFVVRAAVQGFGRGSIPMVASVAEVGGRSIGALVLVHLIGFRGVALANSLAWIGAVAVCLPAWVAIRRDLGRRLGYAIAPERRRKRSAAEVKELDAIECDAFATE